jgi:hypothetical protein
VQPKEMSTRREGQALCEPASLIEEARGRTQSAMTTTSFIIK